MPGLGLGLSPTLVGAGGVSVPPAAGMGTTGLLSYWGMNAASGDEADSHGVETLTAYNAPTTGTGLVYTTARAFDGGTSKHYFGRANASLAAAIKNMGVGADFTVVCWFLLTGWATSSPLDYHSLICTGYSQWGGGWKIATNQAKQVYSMLNAGANGSDTLHYAGTTLELEGGLNVWHMAALAYDAANDLHELKVNDHAWETQAWTYGCIAAIGDLCVGRFSGDSDAHYHEGRIGPIMCWNRLLTASEITWVYNSRAGRAYAEF